MNREEFEKSGRNHIRAGHLHKELSDYHGRRAHEVEGKDHKAKHIAHRDIHEKKEREHRRAGLALLRRALGDIEARERAHSIAEHVREVYGNPEHNSFRPEKAREALERALGEIHPRLSVEALRRRKEERRHDIDEDIERREHEVKASASPSASQHYRASGIHGALTDHHGIRALAAKKAGHEDKARAHNKLADFHQKKADAHFAAGVKKDGGEKSHHSDAAYNSAHKTFGTPGTKHFDVKKANSRAKAALTSNPHEVHASVGELSPVSNLSKDKQAAAHCKLGALHAHLRDHALKNKNFASAAKHSDKSINHHDVAHKINVNAPKKHERIARAAEANVVKHFGKGTDEHFRSHEATKEADRLHKGLYGR